MQKAIVIPADQYDRMVKSYDEAMEELWQLREQLSKLKSMGTEHGQESSLRV